jgi:osmotically-inducible protein OsmY
VILSGTVTTWSQRDAAELAAIQAPGVTQVDNHITVSPAPLAEDQEDELC